MTFKKPVYILLIVSLLTTANLVKAKQSTKQISNIYRLFVAETAIQQNLYLVALENYLAIMKTGNTEVAEIAIEYAILQKKLNLALEIAMMWANIERNNLNAQLLATTFLLDIDPKKTKIYLKQAIILQPKTIDQLLAFTCQKLPENSQKNLYALLKELVKENPKNATMLLCAAQIAVYIDNLSNAENLVNRSLQLQPNLTHAIQLKAKLIRHNSNNNDLLALQYLQQKINKNPNDEELILFYCKALLDINDTNQALPYLKQLTTGKSFKQDAQFILGEIFLKQNQLKKAKEMFIKIHNDPIHGSSAKYYLGQIYEKQNKIQDSINWYTDVEKGQFHIPATIQASLLSAASGSYKQAINIIQNANPETFADQKQLLSIELDLLIISQDYDKAMQLVNRVLKSIPTDVDFLYIRSTIAGYLNLPKQAEQDLLTIVRLDPKHANALNALGYTIASQPERINEAISYLEKALKLSPNNPAFMDSMGWVLFQQGELKKSVTFLNNAYNISDDTEIATHLGEVLWKTGKKQQAKKIWNKALQRTPNNDTLLETLNRLKINSKFVD